MRYLPFGTLLAIVVVAAVFGCCTISGCIVQRPPIDKPIPSQTTQQPIADPLPNLSPEDYAELSGFDASTEQTLREQIRNNDITWRVEKLEREVRRLNQRIYGIAELRIGDELPLDEETEIETQ